MSNRTPKTANLTLPLDKRRILLIEDKSQLLSTLSLYLFRAGAWDVWQAHSCKRARILWNEHQGQIDFIVSDVSLPDGNGMDLIGEFRRNQPKFACLVISGDPLLMRDSACTGKLLKPFTEIEFIAAIREL